jgi:hypothetical protein
MAIQLPNRIMFAVFNGDEINDAVQSNIVIAGKCYDAAALKLKSARELGIETGDLTIEVPLEAFVGLCEIFDAMQRELMVTGEIWKNINDMVRKGNDDLMTIRGIKNPEKPDGV